MAHNIYSHLSNSQGGWNKRGVGATDPELINEDVWINYFLEKTST